MRHLGWICIKEISELYGFSNSLYFNAQYQSQRQPPLDPDNLPAIF